MLGSRKGCEFSLGCGAPHVPVRCFRSATSLSSCVSWGIICVDLLSPVERGRVRSQLSLWICLFLSWVLYFLLCISHHAAPHGSHSHCCIFLLDRSSYHIECPFLSLIFFFFLSSSAIGKQSLTLTVFKIFSFVIRL